MGPVSYPCIRWAHHYGWNDAVWLLKPGYKADTAFAFSSGDAYFRVPACLKKPKKVTWRDASWHQVSTTRHMSDKIWMIPGLSPWAAPSDTTWNEDAHSNCIFMSKINRCCAKPLKSWHDLLHSIREMSLSSLKAQHPAQWVTRAVTAWMFQWLTTNGSVFCS